MSKCRNFKQGSVVLDANKILDSKYICYIIFKTMLNFEWTWSSEATNCFIHLSYLMKMHKCNEMLKGEWKSDLLVKCYTSQNWSVFNVIQNQISLSFSSFYGTNLIFVIKQGSVVLDANKTFDSKYVCWMNF